MAFRLCRLGLGGAARWLAARPRLLAAGAGVTTFGLGTAAVCEPAPRPPQGRTKVLCLHGINLNMFGKRDASTYGTATLHDIDSSLRALAAQLDVDVECFQTNHEGEIVERIHRAHSDGTAAVIINAGAWTHYSYGLRDALAILAIPIVEVHMSNVHAREDMKGTTGEAIRHHSVISPLARGIVAGFGVDSYLLGLKVRLRVGARVRVGLLGSTATCLGSRLGPGSGLGQA